MATAGGLPARTPSLRLRPPAGGSAAAADGELDLGLAPFTGTRWTFSPDQLAATVIVNVHVPPQHDPSARLARLIDLRDKHCSGPGCSHSRCDRDHHDPWPGGPTSAGNLHLLSRSWTLAKHHSWTLVRHPDGSVTWTSPLHRSYDKPSPHQRPRLVDLHAQPPAPGQTAGTATRWSHDQSGEPDEPTPTPTPLEPEPEAAPAPDDDLPPF